MHVWAWREQREFATWVAHGNQGLSAVFEQHDQSILSAGRDQQVALWNASAGALIRRFSGHTEGVGGAPQPRRPADGQH